MGNYELKTVDFQYHDDRGNLVQLVHDGYKQINVVETKKGVVRGKHFHKFSREAFFIVSGSVEVTLCGKDSKETIIFNENAFFEIKPLVIHSMYFPENCIMIAMYDIPIDYGNGEKDIYSIEEN